MSTAAAIARPPPQFRPLAAIGVVTALILAATASGSVKLGALFLVGLALTATLAQLFVIYLLRIEAWSVVSIFAFWEVLAAVAFGILIFGESLSMVGFLGAAFIVGGGMLQVARKDQ